MESATLTNSIPVIQCNSLTRMDAPNYEGSDRVTWKVVEYPMDGDDILHILVLYVDGEKADATPFYVVAESIFDSTKGPQDLQDALKVYYRKWWESLPKGGGYEEEYGKFEDGEFIDFEEINMVEGVEVDMVDMVDNTPQDYLGEVNLNFDDDDLWDDDDDVD